MNELSARNNLSSYEVESKVESFHWWFVGRRRLLKSLLTFVNIRDGITIDVGCGTGSNLKALESARLNVIGLDRSRFALSFTRKKGRFPLMVGDLNELPVKTNSVGLIIAMDLLEHLDDDSKGIKECLRVLNKGGYLILTVPAFGFLWGIQDDVTGHMRRYSKKEIVNKLRAAGYDILRCSYFNFFLFLPILVARRVIRLLELKIESENEVNFPLINSLFKGIFSLELFLLKYFSFPFGVSILCIAKKK